ncbi:MAG TPA: type II secretion system protein [Polyangiaceae bacterium]|nr:type II secretion system protein [Polyangiaceae bacterium]
MIRPAHQRPKTTQRGVTLIEVLVTIAIVAMATAGILFGVSTLSSARLRESAVLVASAIRMGYNHANAKSRTTRMVLTFGESDPNAKNSPRITLEDSPGRLFLQSGDRTGGAAAATEAEAAAIEAAEEILEGPRKARPSFSPIKDLLGFEHENPSLPPATKLLGSGIYFRQVEVEHEEDPIFEDRAYVYFFPGGMAERAHVQIQKGSGDADDADIMTISVAPLTGKVEVLSGAVDLPRPLTEEDLSEREDTGF